MMVGIFNEPLHSGQSHCFQELKTPKITIFLMTTFQGQVQAQKSAHCFQNNGQVPRRRSLSWCLGQLKNRFIILRQASYFFLQLELSLKVQTSCMGGSDLFEGLGNWPIFALHL